jgi:hypothetical protein
MGQVLFCVSARVTQLKQKEWPQGVTQLFLQPMVSKQIQHSFSSLVSEEALEEVLEEEDILNYAEIIINSLGDLLTYEFRKKVNQFSMTL